MWRPCSFSPIHSLTGLVGQKGLIPVYGGSALRPRDASTLTMESYSPVSNVSLHWWPRHNWSRRFTMLRADDAISQRLHHSTVSASQGFAWQCWKSWRDHTSRCFTMLRADDVISRRLDHSTAGASLGFARQCWKSWRDHTSRCFWRELNPHSLLVMTYYIC